MKRIEYSDTSNKIIQSQYKGMEFGIENCAMLLMKEGKITETIEQFNQERIWTFEDTKNYNYLEILATIKQVEMKEKIRKDYFRRTRKLLETNLCNRNLLKKDKNLASSSWKIFVTISKIDKWELKWTKGQGSWWQ